MYRLPTREVRIGNLFLGGNHPVRIQTMTTTDTLDIEATVAQSIRCIEAGAELVRITAPSKKEAEALGIIKEKLRAAGYDTPLVADIHFTPNAAEIAARLIEKVRINPGNYVDKKKFDFIEYTDGEYAAEVARIHERFTPLVRICKEHGTAMRIGTNHGSLSDRIMSRYGDTAIGMVESAMEFLRIAREEDYHQIVLSMKSSNPIVMVEAYRLLVRTMTDEFGECYPLHLGVTEAGDGEDGRIKSAIGIGTLLEEGIGDTVRVSLTEDPEFELPVCRDLVKKALPGLPPAPSEGGGGGTDIKNDTKSNEDTARFSAVTLPPRGRDGDGAGEEGENEAENAFHGLNSADPFAYQRMKEFVKTMRSKPTAAEEKLWEALRGKQISGEKFRRQHILGRYIADFADLEKRLVIEIDGLIHQLPENVESDAIRTAWLNEKGFSVLRFRNEEVLQDLTQVLARIEAALEQMPSLKNGSARAPGLPPVPSEGGGDISDIKTDIKTAKIVVADDRNTSPLSFGEGPGERPIASVGMNLRKANPIANIGGAQVPVVVADFMKAEIVSPEDLAAIGYQYDAETDKWAIADGAADYLFLGAKPLDFGLPGTLRPVVFSRFWKSLSPQKRADYIPLFSPEEWKVAKHRDAHINFLFADLKNAEKLEARGFFASIAADPTVVLCLYCTEGQPKRTIAHFLQTHPHLTAPVIICDMSFASMVDEQLIDFSVTSGALFLDGFGNGIWLMNDPDAMQDVQVSGRTYLQVSNNHQFLNNTAFSILQATRKRISKTEYISCPSCGRTLFDLQETTAKIRAATHHLKGVKIAIMGCIVNGPGEMADADFGYVGSGPGKITLYKSKDVVRKNVDSEVAVDALIDLLKEHGAWTERV